MNNMPVSCVGKCAGMAVEAIQQVSMARHINSTVIVLKVCFCRPKTAHKLASDVLMYNSDTCRH